MKKLLILPILLFVVSLHAQISLGIKGGITHAWQQYAEGSYDKTDHTTTWGANTAITLNYRLNRLWSLQLEPGWMQSANEPVVVGRNTVKLFSSFVQLPVLVQLQLPIRNRWHFVAAAGPSISWLYSGTRKIIIFPDDTVQPADFKTQHRDNRLDYGGMGLAGVGYRIGGRSTILVDARFYLGTQVANPFFRLRSRNLDFRMGYIFDL